MRLTLDSIRALQRQGTNALGRLRNGIDELRNGNFPNFGGADLAGEDASKSKFSVNSFKSALINRDIALTTHYFVSLSVADIPELLSFAACATTLPGYTLNTMEVRRYGVGPHYSYPVTNSVPEIPVTFYVDGQGEILRFFQEWGNAVFNMRVSNSPESPAHYVARYKNEYAAIMTIALVDRSKDVHSQYILRNVYPVQVGQAELAWGDSNILRLPVVFRFDSYDFVNLQAIETQEPERTGFLNDIREAFSKAGEIYDEIQGIRSAVENTRNQIRNININNVFGNFSLENNIFPRG